MRLIILLNLSIFSIHYAISQKSSSDFTIYSKETKAQIVCLSDYHLLYKLASDLLAEDIEQITGYKPRVYSNMSEASGNIILIGNIGDAAIKDIVGESSEFYQKITGKFEIYGLYNVPQYNDKHNNILLISGSDHRGTAYGVFDISERIGINPWYWWADVTPEKKKDLTISIDQFVSNPPSVKYRGIFLNDEDWGLQPWAAKTFEPETGDIGPKTYAKIFELLLRLKANMIWPAMHSCTKAFFHYPENVMVAEKYGIIIGSSHAEPMLRNNVDEWDKKTMGDFNYRTNKETVKEYWQQRVEESKNMEAAYTMGMRGIHDSGMEGFEDMDARANALEEIITDQRSILETTLQKPISEIPQVFIPYKEVLDIYDHGMDLPEDITIMWTDDNYGYIHRLPNAEEKKRSGGSGVYYHISYWGRPHDYLWLSSTHPLLIWEEMTKAYHNEAKQMWIVNVGDIKPAEMNMQLFLSMAYDMERFPTGNDVWKYIFAQIDEIFPHSSEEIAMIIRKYYTLCFERRPEFMGWSQVEHITQVSNTAYNHFYYGDEAQKRLDDFRDLERWVRNVGQDIPSDRRDAYFELIEYPVKCAVFMNYKWLYLEKAYLCAKQGRSSANYCAMRAKAAYDSIIRLTDYYNTQLADCKWNQMMCMAPRNLPVFEEPMWPSWDIKNIADFDICLEGYTGETYREGSRTWKLPEYYRGASQKFFIDLYLKGNQPVEWTATTSDNWISVTQGGILSPETGYKDTRLWVDIDWDKVPSGDRHTGKITFSGNGKKRVVTIIANNIPNDFIASHNSWYEINGYISIPSTSTSRKSGDGWQGINFLGYSDGLLCAVSDENYSKSGNRPWAEYDIYTVSKGSINVKIYCLPTHPLNNGYGLKLTASLDEGKEKIFDFQTFGRSEQWKQNVLSNTYCQQAEFTLAENGEHTLRIEALDPGICIDRIEIDFGGLREGYGLKTKTRLKWDKPDFN
ncbi:MAG: glycosyl hydrolase 115 family protein [Bacteroidales bacterium]|nr:glycosyl hydrolase 115 family protein [Bacteroidales bacterium]